MASGKANGTNSTNRKAGFYPGLSDTLYNENLNFSGSRPTTVNTPTIYPMSDFRPVTSTGYKGRQRLSLPRCTSYTEREAS